MPPPAAQPTPPHDGRSAELRGTARARLLDGALAEVHERGYDGTSLQAIAKRAGLSKGAVYWNFRDKQDLFLTLVRERVDVPARELMRLTETAPSEVETAPLVSQAVAAIIHERPEVVMLMVEHWALAVRDPALRAGYTERQDVLRGALAQALEARHATTGVPLSYPAERLASAIMSLATGLAMQALVEPAATPDELLGEILALLYDGLARRAEQNAQP